MATLQLLPPLLFCNHILDGWERSTIADWSPLKSHFALCPRVARWPVTVSMLTPVRSFCHQGSRKVSCILVTLLQHYDAFAHVNTEEAPLCLSILPQPAVELVYMMFVYYHLCKEVVAVYCQPWYIFEHSDSWYWVNTLVSCSNVRGMCEVTKHHSGNYKLLSKVQSSRWIFGFFLDPTSKSFVPGWLKVFSFK